MGYDSDTLLIKSKYTYIKFFHFILQVSVSYEVQNMISLQLMQEEVPSVHLFNKAQKHIYAMMEGDSMPRFLQQSEKVTKCVLRQSRRKHLYAAFRKHKSALTISTPTDRHAPPSSAKDQSKKPTSSPVPSSSSTSSSAKGLLRSITSFCFSSSRDNIKNKF